MVIAAPGAQLRAAGGTVTSRAVDVSEIAGLLRDEGVSIEPLFGLPEERLRAAAASLEAMPGADLLPDMSLFYRVTAPEERLYALAERLREDPQIQAAYVKPGAVPAQINDMLPASGEAPPATPDFTGRQGYLDAAPGGIDARYAWTRPGGSGGGVGGPIRVIDIEGAWRFDHEDLGVNQGGVIGGTQSAELLWRNHGTAVVGEIGGDRNSIGVTGIAPNANVRAISIFDLGSAAAIRLAADNLAAGEIILIELQRTGPTGMFIAIEWWPDDLAAIRYAVGRGVIVVEAAGNGSQDLDAAAFDTPGSGFPSSWRNPFRRNPIDSGAIVVGAGAPPSGAWGPDRSRLDFSNFGSMVDAQGWGREVVTTGYGDLQGGSNENLWYTSQFSGTSSASPIVVGAIACTQGYRRNGNQPLYTPANMRNLLRTTGSPQQAGPTAPLSQRIGNRPNLRQLIPPKIKEGKDKDKDKETVKDLKDIRDETPVFKQVRDSRNVFTGAGNVEQRVAALEESVQQLTHFITSELRPDLATSALSGEVDDPAARALGEELRKQAVDAKAMKDDKDLEKTRDR